LQIKWYRKVKYVANVFYLTIDYNVENGGKLFKGSIAHVMSSRAPDVMLGHLPACSVVVITTPL